MVKTDVLLPRLRKLSEYLSILERLRDYSEEEFLSDPEHYGSAERFLQLAIEVLNDLGNHIIADDNLGTVDWYRDIPSCLVRHGVIDDPKEKVWLQIIGFRNILVHDYIGLDRSKVYQILHENLSDIRAIQKCIAAQLPSGPTQK